MGKWVTAHLLPLHYPSLIIVVEPNHVATKDMKDMMEESNWPAEERGNCPLYSVNLESVSFVYGIWKREENLQTSSYGSLPHQ